MTPHPPAPRPSSPRLDGHRSPRARRRISAPVVAATLLVAVLAGSLTACYRQPRLAPVRSFAMALGVDTSNATTRATLGNYDVVVVDGEGTSAAEVADLRRRGALVLGYLSVGTLEPWRPWFAAARNGGWLLDHWGDWDEYYAEVSDPGLRKLLAAEATRELAKGFDGLFLDNVDMIEEYPAQAAGMKALVAELDRIVGKGRLLFTQNGDSTVDTFLPYIDGWNREDVTSTYDFDRNAYVATSASDRKYALATMRRLRGKGIMVSSTDYTASATGTQVTTAVSTACSVHALPFVSNIDLTRIPAQPARC